MPNWLKYYSYKIPESFKTILVGTDRSQIINTLNYYKTKRGQELRVPLETEIYEATSLEIRCGLPFISSKFFFKAEVRPNVILDVNANAVDYAKDIAENYEKLKRGDLYKFEPGLSEFGLYFLPEYIMQGISDYDWSQHKSIIDKWKRLEDDLKEDVGIIRKQDIKSKNPNDVN